MNLSEYDVSRPYTATLVSSERITPADWEAEVRHMVLQLPVPEFSFREGQSVGVLVPGPHEFGNRNHLRLYSIASPREGEYGRQGAISICVRRCYYIDDISGERYPGKASNYLCDASPGDSIQITGPYGSRFQVPEDDTCNLLMIGVGTGIAPFRAFVRHIYEKRGGWQGKVRLFYGANAGMELLYQNEIRRDLALYYDEKSFKAFEAVSPRPHFDVAPALDRVLLENSHEAWDLIQHPRTYVYIAGLVDASKKFEKAMIVEAGSEKAWHETRYALMSEGRLSELLYE